MITDHQRHLHRKFTGASAPKQIQQAMVLLAHEDRGGSAVIGEIHLVGTAQPIRQRSGGGANRLARQAETLQLPLNATEKKASTLIAVVIGVNDVAAVGGNPTGEFAHQAGLIRTDHLKDGRSSRHGGAGRSPGKAEFCRPIAHSQLQLASQALQRQNPWVKSPNQAPIPWLLRRCPR